MLPKTAGSAQTHKSMSFIRIVWSTLYVYLWMHFNFQQFPNNFEENGANSLGSRIHASNILLDKLICKLDLVVGLESLSVLRC